jgi:hypothetical protein
MSINVIYIDQLFDSQSLVTRQAARDLFDKISTMPDSKIRLDFGKVSFASRSFFDELHDFHAKLLMLGKQVEILNLNGTLRMLLDAVIETSRSTSSTSYTHTANAETLTF